MSKSQSSKKIATVLAALLPAMTIILSHWVFHINSMDTLENPRYWLENGTVQNMNSRVRQALPILLVLVLASLASAVIASRKRRALWIAGMFAFQCISYATAGLMLGFSTIGSPPTFYQVDDVSSGGCAGYAGYASESGAFYARRGEIYIAQPDSAALQKAGTSWYSPIQKNDTYDTPRFITVTWKGSQGVVGLNRGVAPPGTVLNGSTTVSCGR